MPRSVAEWIGKTNDVKVPERVRLRIWRRQCGDGNFAICPLSKLPIRDTDPKHLDHVKALVDGGEHREGNLAYVHVEAHKRKTAGEVARRADNDVRAKRHLGIKARPTQLTGRDRAQRDADKHARSRAVGAKPGLPPRSLYRAPQP